MTKNRILASASFAALTAIALPALADVGTLSRANCLGFVNESVTYDRPQARSFPGMAGGEHTQLGNLIPLHPLIFSPTPMNWRHYAGDNNDTGTLKVKGYHLWELSDASGAIIDEGYRETSATDCNLTEW